MTDTTEAPVVARDDLLLVDAAAADGIALLTLNRPRVMNCLSTALIEALDTALAELVADSSVRAIVVTGAGEHAFCTGMDLKERTGMTSAQIGAQRRKLISALGYLHRLP